jgi:hypothetical protein
MVLTETTGILCVLIGGYALARPLSVRNFPSATQWESDPEQANREQHTYSVMIGVSGILGGIALLVLGFLGFGP